MLLRLPHELREMMEAWLAEHFPERAAHVLSLIRQTREGKLNDSRFGHRFKGSGPYADLLRRRFERAARAGGFAEAVPLDGRQFAVPAERRGFAEAQMSLF